MNSYIDLHMHSKFSDDGEYEPRQLVDMCKEAGIKIMAIADHNTVKGVEQASLYAKELGIQYIPAIEIDCTYKGLNLHVLGYGIDHKDPVFNKIGKDIEEQEVSASLKKLEKTNALGFEIKKEQMDKISSNGVYTGEMFAEILLNDPKYIDSEILRPYRKPGSRSDNPYVNFYWDYYAKSWGENVVTPLMIRRFYVAAKKKKFFKTSG